MKKEGGGGEGGEETGRGRKLKEREGRGGDRTGEVG